MVHRNEHVLACDLVTRRSPPHAAQLLFRDDGTPVPLEHFYKGRTLFLLGGGPSLQQTDLSVLRRPGIVTMGMNQSWALFRPDLWVCVDTPGRFLDVGWKDPSILKLVPACHISSKLRVRGDDGKLKDSAFRVRDMPSTLYFVRNGDFRPDCYFEEDTVSWGTPDTHSDSLGIANSRSVMLAAIRLAHWLGFGEVCLVGCDFSMPAVGQSYAFPQCRPAHVREYNNALYDLLEQRLAALARVMKEKALKFKIINCTPSSSLDVFPRALLADCAKRVSADCSKPADTRGWYD